jgi:hypothetical protein
MSADAVTEATAPTTDQDAVAGGVEERGARRLDLQHPWPGPAAFTEENARYFFGRSEQIVALTAMVEQKSYVVLYGLSGLGKTSLLQAGLFPRLRKQQLFPILVRLGFDEGEKPLLTQVRDRLAEVIGAGAGKLVGEPPAPGPDGAFAPLWSYFHRTPLTDADGYPATPVLVFDQFEEVFTRGRSRDAELAELVSELADVVKNRIPDALLRRAEQGEAVLPPEYHQSPAKVVIALREDFLAQFDELGPLPSHAGVGFYLKPLNGKSALDAVLEPGREAGLVDEAVARRIVHEVSGAPADTAFEKLEDLNPSLLAMYCDALNQKRIAAREAQIKDPGSSGSREEIFQQFYEHCLEGLSENARRLVENKLLSPAPDNRRVTIPKQAALAEGVSEATLKKLIDRRMLRVETRLNQPYVELVHDVLTGTVARSRDSFQKLVVGAAEIDKRFYYERCLEGLPEGVRRLVEDVLLSPSPGNQRLTIPWDMAISNGVSEGDLEKLVRRRLLRVEVRQGQRHLEIVHDTLTATIARSRDEHAMRHEMEKARRRAEQHAKDEKLTQDAATAKRTVVLGGILFAVVVVAVAIVWLQGQRNALENDKERATQLADLSWRAAAAGRWDDAAQMLLPAFEAVRSAQAQHARLAPWTREPLPYPTPLLGVLSARFEATAGSSFAIPVARSRLSGDLSLSADGHVLAAIGSDGRSLFWAKDAKGGWGDPPGREPSGDEKDRPFEGPCETIRWFDGKIDALQMSEDGDLVYGLSRDRKQVTVWKQGRRPLGFRIGFSAGRPEVSGKSILGCSSHFAWEKPNEIDRLDRPT